jgi:preprotein translocase subunit SecF
MEFFKKTPSIPFMANRKWFYGISTVLMVGTLVLLLTRGLNFGIDFTGGTVVEVGYEDTVDIADVRAVLGRQGFDGAQVQYFGTAHDVLIRLPADHDEAGADLSDRVMAALRSDFGEVLASGGSADAQLCRSDGGIGECSVQMRRVEFVGPQVGRELAEQGGLAMLYALIGILIYVTWRFEWHFAAGSVAALVHDTVITVGIFSLFQWNFDLTILAAVLATIGYSLNDTIVIFDRIRENFRRLRKGGVVEIMNISLNQTLRRTLLTGITTLLVLLAMFFLGGEVLRGFALCLIIGIIVGTYSSIYVASPVALWLGVTRESLLPVKKEGAEADADGRP